MWLGCQHQTVHATPHVRVRLQEVRSDAAAAAAQSAYGSGGGAVVAVAASSAMDLDDDLDRAPAHVLRPSRAPSSMLPPAPSTSVGIAPLGGIGTQAGASLALPATPALPSMDSTGGGTSASSSSSTSPQYVCVLLAQAMSMCCPQAAIPLLLRATAGLSDLQLCLMADVEEGLAAAAASAVSTCLSRPACMQGSLAGAGSAAQGARDLLPGVVECLERLAPEWHRDDHAPLDRVRRQGMASDARLCLLLSLLRQIVAAAAAAVAARKLPQPHPQSHAALAVADGAGGSHVDHFVDLESPVAAAVKTEKGRLPDTSGGGGSGGGEGGGPFEAIVCEAVLPLVDEISMLMRGCIDTGWALRLLLAATVADLIWLYVPILTEGTLGTMEEDLTGVSTYVCVCVRVYGSIDVSPTERVCMSAHVKRACGSMCDCAGCVGVRMYPLCLLNMHSLLHIHTSVNRILI